MTHQEIGAIGPQIVTPEGEYQSPRRFESAFSRLVRFYWLPLLTRPFGASAVERARKRTYADATGDRITGNCDWVSGCLTFLRASAFVQAGMYDENTFLYSMKPMGVKPKAPAIKGTSMTSVVKRRLPSMAAHSTLL